MTTSTKLINIVSLFV